MQPQCVQSSDNRRTFLGNKPMVCNTAERAPKAVSTPFHTRFEKKPESAEKKAHTVESPQDNNNKKRDHQTGLLANRSLNKNKQTQKRGVEQGILKSLASKCRLWSERSLS